MPKKTVDVTDSMTDNFDRYEGPVAETAVIGEELTHQAAAVVYACPFRSRAT